MAKTIRDELLSLADNGYREFHARLMPTVDKNKIIGIRIPVLRKYAKGVEAAAARDFLNDIPQEIIAEISDEISHHSTID